MDARGKITDLPQTGWGKGSLVWGAWVNGGKVSVSFIRESKESITCEFRTSPSLKFFVGTEAQFRGLPETGSSSPLTPADRLAQSSPRCP